MFLAAEFFLNEIVEIESTDLQKEEMIMKLRRAAEMAIRRHGYLWFVGD